VTDLGRSTKAVNHNTNITRETGVIIGYNRSGLFK